MRKRKSERERMRGQVGERTKSDETEMCETRRKDGIEKVDRIWVRGKERLFLHIGGDPMKSEKKRSDQIGTRRPHDFFFCRGSHAHACLACLLRDPCHEATFKRVQDSAFGTVPVSVWIGRPTSISAESRRVASVCNTAFV